jgi:hypothetical protein
MAEEVVREVVELIGDAAKALQAVALGAIWSAVSRISERQRIPTARKSHQ